MEIRFEKLLRPLDKDEYERLKDSCLDDGIRDPLVLWGDVLLDGHNRYRIAQKYGLNYDTERVSLENESQARKWIINNQLGRRNLTPNELSYFRGLRYREEKQSHGGARKPSTQNDDLKTSESLAKEFGVSAPTIQRDEKYAEALDAVTETEGEEYRRKALKGEVSKKEVIEKASPDPIIPKSTGNEWWTPEKYITSVRNVLGEIDLDPASCKKANKTVRAKTIYTKDDDGLEREWFGRVFTNPPYSLNKPFAKKMADSWDRKEISEAIILLGAHAIETKWFSWYWDHTLCFTGHRISFDTPTGKKKAGNIAGSVFIYLGNNPLKFAEEFSKHGNVVRRWPDAQRR